LGLKILSENIGFHREETFVIGEPSGSHILKANKFRSPSIWIINHPELNHAAIDQIIKPDCIFLTLSDFVNTLS